MFILALSFNINVMANSQNLTGNLQIDLNDFANLSREVGYYNHAANQKDEDDSYDQEAIDKYEELRLKQLERQEALVNLYIKK